MVAVIPTERQPMSIDPFPDVEVFNDMVREAVTACNGFVYQGGDLEAEIRLIKWLRENPDKAEVLLDPTLKGPNWEAKH